MPTEQELLRLYRDALESAALWQHKADGYRVMLEGLKMVRGDGLATAIPNAAEVVEQLDEAPASTPEAILRVMRQDAGSAWAPREVWARLKVNGWGPITAANPVQIVGVTMGRMERDGRLVRFAKGLYGLPALTTGGT